MSGHAVPYPEVDDRAPCRHGDPDRYFTRDPAETAAIIRSCNSCPFRQPCLTYALHYAVEGIWGGTTYQERRRWRAQHRRRALPVVPSDRRALWQRIVEARAAGMRNMDIADQFGVSEGSVATVISRSRRDSA